MKQKLANILIRGIASPWTWLVFALIFLTISWVIYPMITFPFFLGFGVVLTGISIIVLGINKEDHDLSMSLLFAGFVIVIIGMSIMPGGS